MDEYIKRDEIRRAYEKLTRTYVNTDPYIADWRLDEMIEILPAADVAPVRHGKWVHSRYENCSEQFEIVKCSCCGHESYARAFYVSDGNYCPNCGAKMDG
jgi:hypothetical protein